MRDWADLVVTDHRWGAANGRGGFSAASARWDVTLIFKIQVA